MGRSDRDCLWHAILTDAVFGACLLAQGNELDVDAEYDFDGGVEMYEGATLHSCPQPRAATAACVSAKTCSTPVVPSFLIDLNPALKPAPFLLKATHLPLNHLSFGWETATASSPTPLFLAAAKGGKAGTRTQQEKRERDRAVASHVRAAKLEDSCLYCPASQKRPKHLAISLAQVGGELPPEGVL